MYFNIDLAKEAIKTNTLMLSVAYHKGNKMYGTGVQRLQTDLLHWMTKKMIKQDHETPLESKLFALAMACEHMAVRSQDFAREHVNGAKEFLKELEMVYHGRLQIAQQFDQNFETAYTSMDPNVVTSNATNDPAPLGRERMEKKTKHSVSVGGVKPLAP